MSVPGSTLPAQLSGCAWLSPDPLAKTTLRSADDRRSRPDRELGIAYPAAQQKTAVPCIGGLDRLDSVMR